MHVPVLLHESIEGLNIKEGGIYVDCTTNRGGHSVEIAKALLNFLMLLQVLCRHSTVIERRTLLPRRSRHFVWQPMMS